MVHVDRPGRVEVGLNEFLTVLNVDGGVLQGILATDAHHELPVQAVDERLIAAVIFLQQNRGCDEVACMVDEMDLADHRVVVVCKVRAAPGDDFKRSAHGAAVVFLGRADEADGVFHGGDVQTVPGKPFGLSRNRRGQVTSVPRASGDLRLLVRHIVDRVLAGYGPGLEYHVSALARDVAWENVLDLRPRSQIVDQHGLAAEIGVVPTPRNRRAHYVSRVDTDHRAMIAKTVLRPVSHPVSDAAQRLLVLAENAGGIRQYPGCDYQTVPPLA